MDRQPQEGVAGEEEVEEACCLEAAKPVEQAVVMVGGE